MNFKINILGCGASAGVPMVGCKCIICKNPESKNMRLRSSILISSGSQSILIDSGTDHRQQMLNIGKSAGDLEVVLYTHDHPDHCFGIEDLRSSLMYSQLQEPLNIMGEEFCIKSLTDKFSFIFKVPKHNYASHCFLKPNLIFPLSPFSLMGFTITPFHQEHGSWQSTGFLFSKNKINFAYSTDANFIPKNSMETLKKADLDLWIVGCPGYYKSSSHALFDQVLLWIDTVKPKRAILTHMGHEIDAILDPMPKNIEPAFDGMEISF